MVVIMIAGGQMTDEEKGLIGDYGIQIRI
jgi:hypothetical protein